MMFKKILIALFIFTLNLVPLWAVTPAQLQQLAGKSTDGIQVSQYAEVYQDALTHLTLQMDQTTGNTRYTHQVMLQDICLHASRPGAEKQRLAMSKALANTLQSKTMTPEIRYWVLLQIERTGKAEVLPVLIESLGSADKTEQGCARAALEKNPAPQATEILLEALATTQDEMFAAGLISSLGNKQDPKVLEVIGQQLDHANRTIATAAVTAIVKINTPDAVAMLKQKLSPTHPASGAIAKGLLDIAAISAGPEAIAIYNELYVWSGKVQPAATAYGVRKAALIGLAENNVAGVDKIIIADFKTEDPAIQSMAIAAAAAAKSSAPAKTMADNSEQLSSDLLNQLIAMLAVRNESSVMTPIRRAIKSNDPFLLQTVIDTLAQLKTQESAEMLLEMTRNNEAKIAKYAQRMLVVSHNGFIDELLLATSGSGDDEQRAAAIVLLGERKTPNITEQLFEYAQSENEIVYTSALKAIGLSASADTIPVLCDRVKTSTVDSFKTVALSAINQILRSSQDEKAAYAIILKEIKAADEDQKVALITTLKMCGDVDAMEYCLGLLSDAEGESFQLPIPQTALKVLSSWSDPMLAKHLLDRAKTSQHKLAYAQAAVDLAKNMLRYSKEQAKKIAEDVEALN
ncbi:MAG: HEAT repeat domain-containing protein, partial [Planctomycetes bacterium]|nr:HEAT repeat domain-containing protein [Planctomycetota bacterium]